ncbi:hypothetical protein EON66_04320 [archaeon]|nr:MAG: hypothetical protein EON66_04320 [archaeon]
MQWWSFLCILIPNVVVARVVHTSLPHRVAVGCMSLRCHVNGGARVKQTSHPSYHLRAWFRFFVSQYVCARRVVFYISPLLHVQLEIVNVVHTALPSAVDGHNRTRTRA